MLFDCRRIGFCLRLIEQRSQRGHALRLSGAQLRLQKIAKEMVIAIPVPLVVKCDYKEVGLFQLREQRRTSR